MKYVLFLVLGYVVMYAVVWLHEIGHSLFYSLFGAEKKWWKVQVKPYIFFSTPGPLYAEDVEKWGAKEFVLSSYGGLMANAVWALVGGAVISFANISNEYVLFALWMFVTLHVGEIFSYLFIGSIYLVSDMKVVDEYMPKLRIPNIIVGVLFAVVYVVLLTKIPESFRLFVIVWNVITVVNMCAGRIIFSIRAEKKLKQAS